MKFFNMKLTSNQRNLILFSLNSKFFANYSRFQIRRSCHKLSVENKTSVQDPEIKFSTLYVPGRYGGQMYQFVKPLIDVKYLEDNIAELEKSCQLRGIELDLQHAISLFKDWTCKVLAHQKLVEEMKENQEEVKRLTELNIIDECEAINKKIDIYMDQINIAKNNVYDIEDIAMPLAQKLPSIIDPNTPENCDSVLVHLKPSLQKSDCHVHIAEAQSLLEFNKTSPSAYYLKGDLAKLELSVQNYFSEKLLNTNFVDFAGVDFCKSFISEAIGLDPHSHDDCIALKNPKSSKVNQQFFVVGGASFQSFCVYFVNSITGINSLPARYFASGRRYEAHKRCTSDPSLFSVVQSSSIHSLILCDKTNESLQFQSLVDVLISIYSSVKIPFRTVNICAKNLNCAESQKVQIELWSPFLTEYVPVAYVSQRSDFISKRLHITYGLQHSMEGYCSIVEGVVVNVPVLLGCLIENYVKPGQSLVFKELLQLLKSSK